MSLNKLVIRRPDDFHNHFRQGELLARLAKFTKKVFGRAVAMPNTNPPIKTVEQMLEYLKEIERAGPAGESCQVLMTLLGTNDTTSEMVREAQRAEALGVKFLPRGLTTNSEEGIDNYSYIYPLLAVMEDIGMPALFHGEHPHSGVFCLDQEREFIEILRHIHHDFPRLKIVFEHITTKTAVEFIVGEGDDTMAATITPHHLLLTLDNLIGGKLCPHHFCKPVAKTPADRRALVSAATSGNPQFFLGTDNAPHLRECKESSAGAAGIFNAPVALPVLAEVFEANGALARLEAFTSEFGARFYGLPLNQGTITLVKETWRVPGEIDGVVPFLAGKEMPWRLADE